MGAGTTAQPVDVAARLHVDERACADPLRLLAGDRFGRYVPGRCSRLAAEEKSCRMVLTFSLQVTAAF